MSRTETDSIGPIEVPNDAYWGAQTQRSLINFAIGQERMPLAVLHALALIKKAEGAIAEKKSGEILAAREQMFKMAETFDMTPQEILDFSVRKRRAPGVPKYRNPANPEQTWTGRGKKPGWLRDAADQEALRIPV